ncbi:hypothetical protein [Microbacterium algeriense]|jgi:hypothetical protein|uniref:hypothetical protein n=1 Tax=Microbacterium algeriense TaxID=2615184 RepID=UPI000F6E77E2|nr:hypothetical protein [Microbacterium algeriense]AZH77421.1 hypothetical protein CSX12_02595 [Microbacterium sp. Y-01]
MLSRSLRATIWGAASALVFAGILFVQSAFGDAVIESDQGRGAPGSGVVLWIAFALLTAALIVTLSLFFRNLALALEARRRPDPR